MNAGDTLNALTVDVEDYFQVSAFESQVAKDAWGDYECRVQENTDRLLALFARHDTKATFFILGWVAERYPGLVRTIAGAGHEVASHGWNHTRANQQSRHEFREDVSRTRALLEDIAGTAVRGFRAASFSIGRDNLWTLEVLKEEGYVYSSSIYPVSHDLYGMPEAPRQPFRHNGQSVLEIPLSTIRLFGRNIPVSGGGYFRLLPYALSRGGIRRANQREGMSAIFYFHPWEVDPEQPRMNAVGLKSRFRHYLNLARTEGRLDRLLADFRWGRMDDVFAHHIDGAG